MKNIAGGCSDQILYYWIEKISNDLYRIMELSSYH